MRMRGAGALVEAERDCCKRVEDVRSVRANIFSSKRIDC
jgi:hypothetical protein